VTTLGTFSAYNNTMEEDLWNTLEEQANIDGVILPDSLSTIMASWTQTENYPLITIKRSYIEGDGALVMQVCSRYTIHIIIKTIVCVYICCLLEPFLIANRR
jgi:hypothetical protein